MGSRARRTQWGPVGGCAIVTVVAVTFYTFVTIGVMSAVGCFAPELAIQVSERNQLRAEKFVELMDAGETEREHEQDFIRASAEAWRAVNEALEGPGESQ